MGRSKDGEEDKLRRSVAPQNAQAILVVHQRAQQELLEARESLKKQSEDLAHTVSMLRATLDATTDAILVTDEKGLIRSFNENFCELLDIPAGVMETKKHGLVWQVVAQELENQQHFLADIDAVYASSPPESFHVLTLADGRIIERYSRIQSIDGRNVGRVWSFREITENRRTEQTLRESERRLLDADRRKNEFLAVLAHELQNPLAAILGATRILQKRDPSEQSFQRSIEIVARQTKQLSNLVKDLLDIGLITVGKLQIEKTPIKLNTILDQAVEAATPLLERYKHTLVLHSPDPPVYFEVDAGRIAQVLGHLLHNAAKSMNEPGRIDLAALKENNHVVISVRDEGIGIPKEMLNDIFKRFVQIGASKGYAEGLGIGLSVVRTLVDLHGGTVEAASEGIGRGSTFTIRLPLTSE